MSLEFLTVGIFITTIWAGILTILFINLYFELKEAKKTINDNFKEVKRDVLALDRRTKQLPDPQVKSQYHVRPIPNIIGEL